MSTRAVLYARVSGDDHDEASKLDAQIAMCREYAGKQGYTILHEFREDKYSSGAANFSGSSHSVLETLGHGCQLAAWNRHTSPNRKPVKYSGLKFTPEGKLFLVKIFMILVTLVATRTDARASRSSALNSLSRRTSPIALADPTPKPVAAMPMPRNIGPESISENLSMPRGHSEKPPQGPSRLQYLLM